MKKRCVFAILALISIPALAMAAPAPFTNHQDGSSVPFFTKLDENRNPLPDSAEHWVMVKDNRTGLIWEVKSALDDIPNYDDPHDADNMYL